MSDSRPFQNLTPHIVLQSQQGYAAQNFRQDIVAGLTVAIVALPLSMAIAIASHVPPQAGLYTAIIGGFLISLLGGSRYQIGGPAGAFIVLVASIVDRHGMSGLLTATFMAGGLIFLLGLFQLGRLVRFVPHPVIIGFTFGIAVIIFASQIHDLLGLTLLGQEPAPMLAKLDALLVAAKTLNVWAAGVAALAVGLIVGLRKFAPRIPALLVAVVVCTSLVTLWHLPIETIASRFGAVPSTLPFPVMPDLAWKHLWMLAPDAVAIALLGSIESLLSAVVADQMTGEQHNSNMELVAQGIANMAVACFAGITATGTIARTATNVKAGAHGPVSGLMHAAFLLLFMVVAARLLGFIPLAALAGILAVVAFNMVDWSELGSRLLSNRVNTLVVVLTALITIFEDLLTGIAIGSIVWWAFHWLELRNKAKQGQQLP
jgi:sulfate permease, SulP family